MDGALGQSARIAVRTANDRLKDSFYPLLWGSITLSTAAHFLVISTTSMGPLGEYGIRSGPELEQVEVIQEFQIPPPPEQIRRPAVPVLSSDLDISEDVTIAAVTFAENPVETLAPPPSTTVETPSMEDQPTFTPYEVRPELKNPGEIQKLLEKSYPALYRDAGIGGRVVLWVFIDESGAVRNTKVVSSTGYPDLDAVAQSLLRERARFSPAHNRDQRVPVWIQIPVDFESRGPTP